MKDWFSLEAVYAKKGDALILHYGSRTKPRWILIDGGHTGVYKQFLRPRLDELRLQWPRRWEDDGALPIEMVMISHADADHLAGILDLANHKRSARRDSRIPPPPVNFGKLWFNGFEDIIANPETEGATVTAELARTAGNAGPGASLPGTLKRDPDLRAVIASTRQGRTLLDHAKHLNVDVNKEYKGDLVMRGGKHPTITKKTPGLSIHVVAPDKHRIDKLRKKWKRDLKKILAKEKAAAEATSFSDSSAFNLSSIVVLVKRGGKTMLLTGDARGDDIIDGLTQEGLLTNGKIEVDLFKLPHHGSDRNVKMETFRDITATDYLISANGEHDNPDTGTLDMLVEGRKKTRTDPFRLHLTFPETAFELISEAAASRSKKVRKQKNALEAFDEWTLNNQPDNMEIVYRGANDRSVVVDLGDLRVFSSE